MAQLHHLTPLPTVITWYLKEGPTSYRNRLKELESYTFIIIFSAIYLLC